MSAGRALKTVHPDAHGFEAHSAKMSAETALITKEKWGVEVVPSKESLDQPPVFDKRKQMKHTHRRSRLGRERKVGGERGGGRAYSFIGCSSRFSPFRVETSADPTHGTPTTEPAVPFPLAKV